MAPLSGKTCILLHFKLSLKLFEFRWGNSAAASILYFGIVAVPRRRRRERLLTKVPLLLLLFHFFLSKIFLSTQTFSICCAAAQCRWSRVMYFTNFKGLNSIFAISGNCRKPFLKPPCLKYSHLGAKEQAEQQPTSDLEIWASRALVFLLPCEWMDPSSSSHFLLQSLQVSALSKSRILLKITMPVLSLKLVMVLL